MTVFNLSNVDLSKQYMFFGERLNLSRFDVQKFPIFYKLTEQQLGFFWQPSEIDLSKDNKDFRLLSDAQKHIFTSNLLYQTTVDSIQSRSLVLALLPHVSIPELESCIEIWSSFEALHSLAYAHIIRNIYPDPSAEFDKVIINNDILNRAKSPVKYYDDFINATYDYKLSKIRLIDLKEKLLLCIASINILEGVSFFASFACSFAFAELGLMQGNAAILSLIARDEQLHLGITQNILKKWINGDDDPDMKKLFERNIYTIGKMFLETIEIEKKWAEYLFKDGSMMGLNTQILQQYVEYIVGKRMKNLGIKHDFATKNPLSWTDKYLKSSDNQIAPQEQELTQYIIGGIKNDITDTSFDEFKF